MLKQILAVLKSLGWLKLLVLAVVVVGLTGTAVFFYLRHGDTTPAAPSTPTPMSTPKPESTPTQTPTSTAKPTETPKPTTTPAPKPGSAPAIQTPTPNTPPASTPTPPPTSPPTSSACSNPSWSSSASTGTWNTNGYQVNNNMWSGDAGPQTIYACAWNNWYIISDQPGTGTDDGVKTYPDTQKHVNIPLNTMTTINSSWNVSTPSVGGAVPANGKQWNAAYDLWLDDWDYEVMVWTNWTANWQYWYGQYNGVDVTIGGVVYHAYHNSSGGMWFIRKDVTNTGSVDLAAILRWAVSQGWLQNTTVLNEIEYGFEVLYTGTPTRFDLLNYTLTTN